VERGVLWRNGCDGKALRCGAWRGGKTSTIFKHLVLLVIYSVGAPGDVVASGSSLVLPRAATGTRGQYSLV
jgi:hypothetical protein